MKMLLKLQLLLVTFLFGGAYGLDCPARSVKGFPGFHTAPCYLYERFETQFVTAERMCRLSGGHLASISDGFVNAFVAHGANEAFLIMEVDDFWIGGENLEDQQRWEWVDGQKWGYTRWDKDQPNNDTLNRCSAMKLIDGKWTSKNCFDRKPYVCALDYVQNGTTEFPSTKSWFTSASPFKTETWMTTLEQLATTQEASTVLSTERSTVLTTPGGGEIETSTQEASTVLSTEIATVLTTPQGGEIETSTQEASTVLSTERSTFLTTQEPSTPTSTQETSTALTTQEPSTSQPSTREPSTREPSTREPSTVITTEQTTIRTTTEEVETVPVCPDDDWLYITDDEGGDNQCYNVYPSSGWEADQEFCKKQGQGGSLISIHDSPTYLKTFIYNTEGTKGKVDLTIGLKETVSDGLRQWAWVDETPLDYENWLVKPEPAHSGAPFRCATYFTDILSYDPKFGKWKVVDCNSIQARVVCQQEPTMVPEFLALHKKKSAKKLDPRKH